MRVRTGLFVVAGLALAALGCVTGERDAVVAAREAHAACVREYPADDAECVVLQERVHSAERRYESNAQRAWGCDPAQGECPTPR